MTMLSVVIPAFNEERGIEAIARRVLSIAGDLVDAGVEQMELLIVDDGSKDRTAEVASSIQNVRIIRHSQNKGYGAALKTGFSQARGELIGFLDADGTYPPEHFPQLCRLALQGADLVIGSRMAGEKSQMPLTRRVGNLFFATLLTLVTHQRVTDSASGMRVFRREILERLYPLPDGLNLTPVMSTRAIHERVKIAEVPIPYSERVGRSKLSVVRDGSIFLQSILWTALTYNPVRILGLLGLGGLGISALIFLGMIIARLSGITTLSPLGVAGLYLAVVSAVTGVSLVALGITFNYLVALFYNRPIRQGMIGRPILPGLDHHFGWMGIVGSLFGLLTGIVSLLLGMNGWDIDRLWLWLLGSAMIFLIGVQLSVFWIVLRVLDELHQRNLLAQQDSRSGRQPDGVKTKT
ncbi:MAG: glycosyltransferase [Anaerolineales bacterium]|nr:glycosyltransferase [Anaerolineales bacterium]